ncbi:MAG: metallophosphoesterase family protein [Candidatus Brocadiia bacterium]
MKLADAVNDLLGRTTELLEESDYSDHMLERVYRMKEELVTPSVRALKAHPQFAASAEALEALFSAVEEYVVCYQREPERREERRLRVEGLKSRVRRELLPKSDREAEVEHLVDEIRQWQVKTTLDASGRLVYSTAGGAVVPPRDLIGTQVGISVIEQAVKAQRPYEDKIRPRDSRGKPGGLILLEGGRQAIVVGDLHGRYDNLESILKDGDNLREIVSGNAHLIFCGDAVHPRSSKMESPEAYEDSFCVMLLIMTLKAENPFNVHYLIGNHDNAHVGGPPASRGQVQQDEMFEKFVTEKFGASVFKHYCRFVANSPVAAKVKTPNGSVLLVHACLTPRAPDVQALINIFSAGRTGEALQDLLWSRNYDRAMIEKSLAGVGAKFAISGHTSPKIGRAERYGFTVLANNVVAHAHDLQIILSAQDNSFGYAVIDMTHPLPDKITAMTTPDGRPAFRVLRAKPAAAPKPENPK